MFKLQCVLLSLVLASVVQAADAGKGESFIDPTRPPGEAISLKAQKREHRLQSILYSTNSSRSLAIINGKTYAIGDRSPLGVIERIDRDSVSVRGDKQRVVKLQRDLNKEMVAGK